MLEVSFAYLGMCVCAGISASWCESILWTLLLVLASAVHSFASASSVMLQHIFIFSYLNHWFLIQVSDFRIWTRFNICLYHRFPVQLWPTYINSLSIFPLWNGNNSIPYPFCFVWLVSLEYQLFKEETVSCKLAVSSSMILQLLQIFVIQININL